MDKKTDDSKDKEKSSLSLVFVLIGIFSLSIIGLIYVYSKFPNIDESEKQFIKIPFNLEDAKNLGRVLDKYKEQHFTEVILGIILVYIFLQTFAIPGSLFLSILSGFLFDFVTAITLICCCSALGATFCYTVSQFLGKRLVLHYFPDRIAEWSKKIEKHKSDLFSYMLFLRMTPLLPNWFINLTAPVLGVPLSPFVFGTFFGVAPPSFIAVQAGKTLYKMTSSSDAFSFQSTVILSVLSVLSLSPVIFKKYFKSKVD